MLYKVFNVLIHRLHGLHRSHGGLQDVGGGLPECGGGA